MTGAEPAAIGLVAEVWPGLPLGAATVHRGMSHVVVVVPGELVVRIAQSPIAAGELRRGAVLLNSLAREALPFAVPRPLGPVIEHRGFVLQASSFVAGRPRPHPDPGLADPAVLRALLATLAALPLSGVTGVMREYAGGPRWAELARKWLLPRLPVEQATTVSRAIDAALALPPPERPVLVHGDLGGSNLCWEGDRLVGVLDWDLAFAGDPAYDVASLAGFFGWDTLGGIVDSATIGRARVYRDVFLVESFVAETLRGATGAAGRLLGLVSEAAARPS